MTSTAEIAVRHRGLLAEYLAQVRTADLVGVVGALEAARQAHTPVYVGGNGGSAANASHLVLHLRQAGLLAIDLGHAPLLTAIGNDMDYASVFDGQLLPEGGPATIVAISCSGRSANILAMLRRNHPRGTNLGILGFGGGPAASLCDHAVVLAGTDYGVLEDAHSAIVHMLAEALLGERYR